MYQVIDGAGAAGKGMKKAHPRRGGLLCRMDY